MPLKTTQFATCAWIPDSDGAIPTAGGHYFTVRRKSDGGDFVGVSSVRTELLAGFHVPQTDGIFPIPSADNKGEALPSAENAPIFAALAGDPQRCGFACPWLRPTSVACFRERW